MPNTLVQFRVEEEVKKEAAALFEELGLDLSTALRMFLVRSIKEGGIPFDMKLDETLLEAKRNAFRAEHEGRR